MFGDQQSMVYFHGIFFRNICVLDFFDVFPATNKEIKINVLV